MPKAGVLGEARSGQKFIISPILITITKIPKDILQTIRTSGLGLSDGHGHAMFQGTKRNLELLNALPYKLHFGKRFMALKTQLLLL